VHTTFLWNNLYQVHLKSKDWKPNNLKVFDICKPTNKAENDKQEAPRSL